MVKVKICGIKTLQDVEIINRQSLILPALCFIR